MLIYKEGLPITTSDIVKVDLPYQTVEDAKKHILKLDMQYDMPNMWYQVDGNSEETYENKEFYIIAIGTGHDWSDTILSTDNYIGTLLLCEGMLVLHYFLLDSLNINKRETPDETDIIEFV